MKKLLSLLLLLASFGAIAPLAPLPVDSVAHAQLPIPTAAVVGPRAQLNAALAARSCVANYQKGVGLTGTTNASAWANQIGTAGSFLQATGAAQPAIQADGSLLFNGSSHYMAATAAISQPNTYYLVLKQVTWRSAAVIFDGVGGVARQILYQHTATPKIDLYAGSVPSLLNADLAVDTYGLITVIFNGASSSIKVDSGTVTTGNPGAQGVTGITLGAAEDLSIFGNIQVKEFIICPGADSAANQAQTQSLLKQLHGTP